MSKTSKRFTTAVIHILKPLVRLLLRQGIAYGAFCDLVKQAYVDVADTEFSLPGKAQTVGRISTLTGLTRKEVTATLNSPVEPDLEILNQSHNRAARVLSAWVREVDFQDGDGQPAELPLRGDKSFNELVKRFSGDVATATIADELSRIGAIEQTNKNCVRLIKKTYIPIDENEKLIMGCRHISDLIRTIDHNVHASEELPLFERITAYNAIPKPSLISLREKVREIAGHHLIEFDKLVASYSHSPTKESGSVNSKDYRVGVGIYYFERSGSSES